MEKYYVSRGQGLIVELWEREPSRKNGEYCKHKDGRCMGNIDCRFFVAISGWGIQMGELWLVDGTDRERIYPPVEKDVAESPIATLSRNRIEAAEDRIAALERRNDRLKDIVLDNKAAPHERITAMEDLISQQAVNASAPVPPPQVPDEVFRAIEGRLAAVEEIVGEIDKRKLEWLKYMSGQQWEQPAKPYDLRMEKRKTLARAVNLPTVLVSYENLPDPANPPERDVGAWGTLCVSIQRGEDADAKLAMGQADAPPKTPSEQEKSNDT